MSEKKETEAKTEVKEDTVTKYFYGAVYGVNYVTDNNSIKRIVRRVQISDDVDHANDPEWINKARIAASAELEKDGFWTSDRDAFYDIVDKVPGMLDALRHEIEYEHKCKHCTCNDLDSIRKLIETLKHYMIKCDEFNVDNNLAEPIKVFPDNIDDCKVVNNLLVDPLVKSTSTTIHVINVTGKDITSLKKVLQNTIGKYTRGENKFTSQIVENIIHTIGLDDPKKLLGVSDKAENTCGNSKKCAPSPKVINKNKNSKKK